jgi:hypothetical protein
MSPTAQGEPSSVAEMFQPIRLEGAAKEVGTEPVTYLVDPFGGLAEVTKNGPSCAKMMTP